MNVECWFTVILLIQVLHPFAEGSKILLLPHLQGSHVYELHAIGEELSIRHHDVYSALPQHSKFLGHARNRGITPLTFEIEETVMLMESDSYNDLSNEIIFEKFTVDPELHMITIDVCEAHCDHMLHDKTFMASVKRLGFDLVIVDAFVVNRCLLALPAHFAIPYIAFSGSITPWNIGVPALPSFVPSQMSPFRRHMSIWDKLQSTMIFYYISSDRSIFNQNKDLLYEFVPKEHSWIDLLKKAKLFVLPKDYILEYPRPSMPNVVYTPGVVYESAKPLPDTFIKQISGAKGIIVVSFGSTAGGMPVKYIQTFAHAFAQFPEYVVYWKLPKADTKSLPSNVHALPWLPQNDLLGHSATKVFITHCGSNGLHEALYHGVPIIGFPLFAEQPHNALMVEDRGYGVSLDIHNFTSEELVRSINHVTNSEAISNKVSKISKILKERQPPKEEIANWIEHMMKYGDEHLRSIATDMDFYELLMIDVLVVVWIATLSLVIGVVLMCTCICRCCSQGAKSKSKKD